VPVRLSRDIPIRTGVFATQFPLRFWKCGASGVRLPLITTSFSTVGSRSSVYRADFHSAVIHSPPVRRPRE
jgi:hypothetical protein